MYTASDREKREQYSWLEILLARGGRRIEHDRSTRTRGINGGRIKRGGW